MTHFLKFFLNKGRILALWVMYGLSGKLGDGHGQKKTLFNFFFGNTDGENVPKIRAGVSPAPHLDKIQKKSSFSSEERP